MPGRSWPMERLPAELALVSAGNTKIVWYKHGPNKFRHYAGLVIVDGVHSHAHERPGNAGPIGDSGVDGIDLGLSPGAIHDWIAEPLTPLSILAGLAGAAVRSSGSGRVLATFAGVLVGLRLAAGGNSTTDPVDTPEIDTVSEAIADNIERPTKESLLVDFEDALEVAQATIGPGKPAMWTLADDDTTIYIFGTVHLLRPDLEWRSAAFDGALAAANKVVFEVDIYSEAGMRSYVQDFVGRGMFEDGRTLTVTLNESDEEIVANAFDSIGVPIDAMNTFEPWMAYIQLGSMKLVNDGYDPESGVESVIREEAIADGKAFAYLEDSTAVADALDLLPEHEQIAALHPVFIRIGDAIPLGLFGGEQSRPPARAGDLVRRTER